MYRITCKVLVFVVRPPSNKGHARCATNKLRARQNFPHASLLKNCQRRGTRTLETSSSNAFQADLLPLFTFFGTVRRDNGVIRSIDSGRRTMADARPWRLVERMAQGIIIPIPRYSKLLVKNKTEIKGKRGIFHPERAARPTYRK